MILVQARTEEDIQTEFPGKHAALYTSRCRMCWEYLLLSEINSDNVCGRCTLMEELLCLLTELWDAVDRLRSICKSEKGVKCWNSSVLSEIKMLARDHTWPGVSCILSLGRRQ